MKFKILFFSLSIILANDNIQLNSLLFCIKENVDNIVISNNNNTIKTNYESIDVILNELNNPKIERGLLWKALQNPLKLALLLAQDLMNLGNLNLNYSL